MSQGGRCESRDPIPRALRPLLLATGLLVLSCAEEGRKDPVCTVTDAGLTFCRVGVVDSADSWVVGPFDSQTIPPAPAQVAPPATATVRSVQPGESIQAALNLSVAGDSVLVEPGVYPGNLNFGGKDVALVSRAGAEATSIAGTGGTAILIGPRASISGFTIRGGSASFGAGMSVSGTGSVISDNIFDGNLQGAGGFGAGIAGNSASPTIARNVFRNHTCDGQFLSGVVSFVNSSSPRIADNLFVDNSCRAVNLTLPVGNRPVVVNNTMVRNPTGIRFDRRISAAMHVYANNILWGNAIGVEVDFGTEANNATFVSNLVSGNTVNYDGIVDQTGSNGNLGNPPGFLGGAQNPFRLTPGSASVDAGAPGFISSTDLEGRPRAVDGNADGSALPDIGALELNPDLDGDGIQNGQDNCPEDANPGQADVDGDAAGDTCDNCPSTPNGGQEDFDRDGSGDVCDEDSDGDGAGNGADNCPLHPNPDQLDHDVDGSGDICDNCADDVNTGQLDLDMDGIGDACDNCLSQSNPGYGLDGLAAALAGDPEAITHLIPDRFNFSGGETGSSISDGGADMYDGGNVLNTNLASAIPYTNGVIQESAAFGPGSRHVTLKVPGLFVLAVENAAVASFRTTGNNGADGGGTADGAVIPMARGFTLFLKRVHSAGDPSINQLILVPSQDPGITHNFPSNTNDGLHEVLGLADVDSFFYLLVARQGGGLLADETAIAIAEGFLSFLGQADRDDDGVGDACDICPGHFNPEQDATDVDGDGLICEKCPVDALNDVDADGFCANDDNCPFEANPNQADTVHPNGIGDVCDDPDGDASADAFDNCADVGNADQLDRIHPNDVGDACDDPDADGTFDLADNCADEPNPDQGNDDSDVFGSACDICPSVANPDQDEVSACIAVTSDGGECVEAEIELRAGRTRGEIQLFSIEEAIPQAIVIETLATSCSASDHLEILLNGSRIGTFTLDPSLRCACSGEILRFQIDDPVLIHPLWRVGGPNVLTVEVSDVSGGLGSGTAVAWVRVGLLGQMESTPVCVFDIGGGNCTDTNLCAAGYRFDPPPASIELDAFPDATLIHATPYEGGVLPERVALSGVAGSAQVCVLAEVGSALYGSSKGGEIFAIDLETGSGRLIGVLPVGVTEIELQPGETRAFAQASDGSFFGQFFDVRDGTLVGNGVDNGASFTGLEYVGSVLYATAIQFGGAPSSLRILDPATGSSTLVGPTGLGPIPGLAWDDAKGVLYGVTGGSGPAQLVTLSLVSGAASSLGSLGVQAGSLELGPDGALYLGGTGSNAGQLYRIDLENMQAVPVGDTGFDGVTGLMLVEDIESLDCHDFQTGGEKELVFNGAPCGPPVANAGPDVETQCTGSGTADVLLDASSSTDPSSTEGTNDDIVRFEWFEDLGGADQQFLGAGETLTIPFTLGRHEATLRVTDSLGTTDEDPVTVTVVDTLPASLLVSMDPAVLWPPNKNLVSIRATVSAVDACGSASVVLQSVTSSESDDGGGDGNTEGDIQGANLGTPDFEFALRAERSGLGPGRRYEVTYSATDASGNQARVTQFVSVLHDRGNDRDGDGIGDADEVSLGTSPDDGDSDDDGFADDLEVARGTDPLSPASIAASPVAVPALGGAAVALLMGSLTLIGAVMLRGRW